MRKLIGAAVLAIVAGCGGSDSGGGGGGGGATTTVYCLWAGDMCSQVGKTAGFSPADLTALQSECATNLGTYGVGACSTAGTVAGNCYYSDFAAWSGVPVTGATLTDYYYTAIWTPTTAAGDCGGVWSGAGGGGGGATTVTESEPNGTPGTADGPYTSDQVIGGAIPTSGDEDVFAITNSSGAPVLVHFETFSGPGVCSGIDTVLEINDSGSNVLATNDDGGLGFCSSLDYSIPAGTTVYARVMGFSGSTVPAYQLWVNFP